MKKEVFLKVAGWFLVFLGLFSIFYSLYNGRYEQILWFCYIASIIVGVGFLMKRDMLIISQLNILVIPLVFWNIDFFYRIFNGKILWGQTDYFFNEGRDLISNFITLQHIYLVPLCLVALYLIRVKGEGAWKLSVLEVVLIFVTGRLFTSRETNMNCVFEPCFPVEFGFPYWIAWFGIMLFGIYFVNHLVSNSKYLRD